MSPVGLANARISTDDYAQKSPPSLHQGAKKWTVAWGGGGGLHTTNSNSLN